MGTMSVISGIFFDQLYFKEQSQPYEGVECFEYGIADDSSRDLAIIRVLPNHATPRQRVLSGRATIEGWVAGSGRLVVESIGRAAIYTTQNSALLHGVTVGQGEVMQWQAGEDGLLFAEICEPPYEEGRFENL